MTDTDGHHTACDGYGYGGRRRAEGGTRESEGNPKHWQSQWHTADSPHPGPLPEGEGSRGGKRDKSKSLTLPLAGKARGAAGRAQSYLHGPAYVFGNSMVILKIVSRKPVWTCRRMVNQLLDMSCAPDSARSVVAGVAETGIRNKFSPDAGADDEIFALDSNLKPGRSRQNPRKQLMASIVPQENMPRRFVDQPLMDLLPVERGGASASDNGLTLSLTEAGKTQPVMMIANSADESRRPGNGCSGGGRSTRCPSTVAPSRRRKPGCARRFRAEWHAIKRTGEQPDRAMLSWHYVGTGKVVYLASPTTYLLRFRNGDRCHHRFWGQLLRWMTARDRAVGTETVRIATDRDRYRAGEEVDVVVRLKDTGGNPIQRRGKFGAVAETKDGGEASLSTAARLAVTIKLAADEKVPGQYHGQIPGLPCGLYRIEPTGETVKSLLAGVSRAEFPSTLVTLEPTDSLEMVNTQCNRPLLERIAELTGGQVVRPPPLRKSCGLPTSLPSSTNRRKPAALEPMERVVDCVRLRLHEWVVRKRLGLA